MLGAVFGSVFRSILAVAYVVLLLIVELVTAMLVYIYLNLYHLDTFGALVRFAKVVLDTLVGADGVLGSSIGQCGLRDARRRVGAEVDPAAADRPGGRRGRAVRRATAATAGLACHRFGTGRGARLIRPALPCFFRPACDALLACHGQHVGVLDLAQSEAALDIADAIDAGQRLLHEALVVGEVFGYDA